MVLSFRRLALSMAILVGLASQATAATPTGTLPSADLAEVARAEAYLDEISTLKARFLQVAPSGQTTEGTVYLWRPGRLRLEYDPPSPVLVVTSGSFLVYYDKDLKQVSYIGLDSTPAGILVEPKVRLNGEDLQVTRVAHPPGVVTLTVLRRKDPNGGQITLVFSERPYELRQWQVVDPQGQVTQVSLFDPQRGVTLDRKLFRFENPNMIPDYLKEERERARERR